MSVLHDGQGDGGGFAGFDFGVAGAEFADGIRGEDVDDFFAELGFSTDDLVLEFAGFGEERFENLFFGDVGDFLSLYVDDAAFVAGEDGDVSAFALAGAVDDATHDGDFDGQLDVFVEGFVDLLDEGEEVDLDAAAGGAADEFGAFAGAQAEDVHEFEAVLDFVDGVVGVGDADGVADAGGEEVAEGYDGADGAGFLGAGVGDAEVEGVVEAFGDFFIGGDDQEWVDGFGGDDDVVEVSFVEDIEVFLELGDHDGEEVAMLVVGEDAAEFLEAFLFVFAFDDGAFVDADADGDAAFLAGIDDFFDLGAVVDVAGVEADLVDAGLDGFEGALEVEVDVGNDGDFDLFEDFLEGFGVFAFGYGDADDVGTGLIEFVDFGDAFVDVIGIAGGHGLDGNGGVSADANVADGYLAGFTT